MTQKNNKSKHIFLILVSFLFCLTLPVNAQSNPPKIEAKAAIAIDAVTGEIFLNQNADTPLPIASITKILSMYLVEKNIREGHLTWTDRVKISPEISELSVAPELSNVPLEEKEYTVKELFDSAMIQSANASVMALAEKIAGSEKAFIDQMRQQLLDWGITDSYIVTSSGVNNEDLGPRIYPGSKKNDENLLSAKAVSIVARNLIREFPDILTVASIRHQVFDPKSNFPVDMYNSNRMLPEGVAFKAGVDGLKTGFTDKAGPCFVGTIEKNGHRLITVVLNSTKEHAFNGIFFETEKMMDYVFDQWIFKELVPQYQSFQPIRVENAINPHIKLQTTTSYRGWVKKDAELPTHHLTVEMNYSNTDQLKAPIPKGAVLGKVRVQTNNPLGNVSPTESLPFIPLELSVDAEPISNWMYFKNKLKNYSLELSKKILFKE